MAFSRWVVYQESRIWTLIGERASNYVDVYNEVYNSIFSIYKMKSLSLPVGGISRVTVGTAWLE